MNNLVKRLETGFNSLSEASHDFKEAYRIISDYLNIAYKAAKSEISFEEIVSVRTGNKEGLSKAALELLKSHHDLRQSIYESFYSQNLLAVWLGANLALLTKSPKALYARKYFSSFDNLWQMVDKNRYYS